MNKKKNQTSIDLDAIMTEVLNLFTPEEQQEVIDILSNNGLEKIYQQMEEAFYHYQHPDYSSEATPIATYLQRLWMQGLRKEKMKCSFFLFMIKSRVILRIAGLLTWRKS